MADYAATRSVPSCAIAPFVISAAPFFSGRLRHTDHRHQLQITSMGNRASDLVSAPVRAVHCAGKD